MIAAVAKTTAETRSSAKQGEPADYGTHDYIMVAYDGLHTADNELSFVMNAAALLRHAALLPGDWFNEIADLLVARSWAAKGVKGPSRRRSQAWLEEIEWRCFHSRMGEKLPSREDAITDIVQHSATHRGINIGRKRAGDIYDEALESYAARDYAVGRILVR
jgi:hypothetical protein